MFDVRLHVFRKIDSTVRVCEAGLPLEYTQGEAYRALESYKGFGKYELHPCAIICTGMTYESDLWSVFFLEITLSINAISNERGEHRSFS